MDNYRDLDEAVNKAVRAALKSYDTLAGNLIDEDGVEVEWNAQSDISHNLYRELKACRDKSRQARTLFGLKRDY